MARGGGRSPFQVTLRAGERRFLKARARQATAPYRQVVRARIVLLAAAGLTSTHIARKLGIAPNTVSKWRKRFWTEGVDGLADRKRPGRPRVFAAAVVACAKAIACELPATGGVPLGRWSLAELREELLATGLVDDVSTTTLWRWLHEDALQPWRHHPWIFPRDPDFAAKAGRVLDPYARVFQARSWERLSTSSAPTRRRASRRAAAATPPCRRTRPGSCASSMSTNVGGRWPTWPPGTSTRPACSAAASLRPASNRSAGWSPRS